MTHIELRDDLDSRIGWSQTPSTFPLTLDAENLTSDSGRYFNLDEHSFVTLDIIYNTMEEVGADAPTFNAHLKKLRDRAILLVLADVFRVSDVQDDVLTGRVNLFDNAISKRLAIIIAEEILLSLRSNKTERVTKELQQKVFWELNGNESNIETNPNPNFPTFVGLKSRYGQEVNRLRDILNQEEALDVFTLRLPNYSVSEPAIFPVT